MLRCLDVKLRRKRGEEGKEERRESGEERRKEEVELIALKKGAQLLKYGHKGKPKFCPFRLSNDETSLIWSTSSGERSLRLAAVSKIIPGQRTAVFQRYLCPEKDCLSFSLIYDNGKRSLDLDGRDLTSNSASVNSVRTSQDISSLEISLSFNPNTSPKSFGPENSFQSARSHVASDGTNMQIKGPGSDVLRVSVSSAPSTSSHGSATDDYDALGDVYIWGEVICDSVVKVVADKNTNYLSTRADVLIPRPLESNVVLDVHHVACGVKHAALVTRQGEVFTWGEESGGRLGHGVGKEVSQPHLVESLAVTSVSLVACGEFHTCAITMAGELYTWGDGTHNAGLLGHGSDVSHWVPKRISGPLEGLQVATVMCGPWHTTLITSTGQLFTFGDGTFGVLGHGDRENVPYPREVESLSGLRTIAVACGVWHTAAVVEAIVTQSTTSVSSGKLFTWGDGDKNRLGHGDKEPRLKPTCVLALIDYNFHKVACGHSLTVGLTTSGNVFTMGSTVYGQLGNHFADGKIPCLVEDKLSGECVEEIACGAYHVAALTSRNEVYTWGKGANGRLGHGDVEDRKTPTLVESLKDRHVKYMACGSTYSAAICLHKWVSGTEESQCSACRQAFGFTRKRHNCYNCGLVHCHSCSSRKALRAALAPNPRKPYRVCDSCFAKMNKVFEAGNNRRNSIPRLSAENKDRFDKAETRLSKSASPSNIDLIKQLDIKAAKQGKKAETFSLVRSTQAPSLLQLKDVALSTTLDLQWTVPKPILTPSGMSSRSVSPLSRKPSPPRSATPIPTTSGLSFSKNVMDRLKKTNDLLNQEVLKLCGQVETLRMRCELQESELQKSTMKAQEAMALAVEESAKSEAAKEVIKSLTAQLKDMAARLPPGVYDTESIKPTYLPNGLEQNGVHCPDSNGLGHLRSDSIGGSFLASPTALASSTINCHSDTRLLKGTTGLQEGNSSVSVAVDGRVSESFRDSENGMECRISASVANGSQADADWIEQYEPGVYITLVALQDGTRDLKRVRFSRRRFGEHRAECWWSENREKVYERYNVRGSNKTSGGLSPISQK
ncbi:Regulator of chromosome condensation (RCC1) family with FYVE zinc finger domain isoform 3 [Hibiscus syriacus]|uniref:Regulator of chromosome condensation (RCC1) family with FYVE zinc finger domain isoform 3 n=1 Tax=Hibiscus syriacus TaxID=106335 RepID=A0A6A2YY77_HIBSY|nr:Regulator of chromosome condensation (RCC1) family with FYVE zinc finger domain isoform 3 [Hibiscus syriacus]